MMRLRGFVIVAVTLMMAAVAFAATTFPALTGRVVDEASLLTPEQVVILNNRLADVETKSGHQVAIAIVKSLDGLEIADYSNQLFRSWHLGQKDKNDGVLLVVAPTERKVRIEVGYGLEGDLTDATSSVIIRKDIVPKFKTAEYFSGFYAATEDIEKVILGQGADIVQAAKQPLKSKQSTLLSALPFIVFFIIVIFILSRGSRGGLMYLPMGGGGFGGGGRGGFGGGGGNSGGGGFSGGGGDSGGGGASGSW